MSLTFNWRKQGALLMFDPLKPETWKREHKFPFQDKSRSISTDGLTDDQFRLLCEICTMHTYHRGIVVEQLMFGNIARVHFTDSCGSALTAFHTAGVTDTELIDFSTLTKVGIASRITIERWQSPVAGDGWMKTVAGQPLYEKSHVLWMGASSTGWFNVLVGRCQHQFAQAMAK